MERSTATIASGSAVAGVSGRTTSTIERSAGLVSCNKPARHCHPAMDHAAVLKPEYFQAAAAHSSPARASIPATRNSDVKTANDPVATAASVTIVQTRTALT